MMGTTAISAHAEMKSRETVSMKGLLIVLSGPSGVGKGTVCAHLRERTPDLLYSVSATTRAPRAGEVDGVNYFFKTPDQFQHMIDAGDLLEWAQYVGHFYGTPRSFVQQKLDAGHDVILEIEVQGALQVRRHFPDAVFVFLLPPSLDELRNRMVGRGTETETTIASRMEAMATELRLMRQYDYTVINDDIEQACQHIHSIMVAEHSKAERHLRMVQTWLEEE